MELSLIPNFDTATGGHWLAEFHPEDFPKKELLQAEVPWLHFSSTYNGTSEDYQLLNLFKYAALSGTAHVVNMHSLIVKKNSPYPLMVRVIAERFGISEIFTDLSDFPYRQLFLKFASAEVTDYSFAHYFLLIQVLAKTIASKSRSVVGDEETLLIKRILTKAETLPDPVTMNAFFNLYFGVQYVASFKDFGSEDFEATAWAAAVADPDFTEALADDLWRSKAMNADYSFILSTIRAGSADWLGTLEPQALQALLGGK